MTDQVVAPVSKAARVESLDVLRGISLLGILMMNITAFGLLFQAYDNPLADGGGTGIDLAVYKIINVGFEGTMRGIFSILFGAGVVLLTERMETGGAGIMAAEIHFRRMMWMMLFGIIHWALLLWTGEILFLYSMCGLLVFAPRKLPAKVQLGAGLALLVCAALFTSFDYGSKIEAHDKSVAAQAIQASGKTLTKEQTKAIEDWKESEGHIMPTAEDAGEQRKIHSGSYPDAVVGQFHGSFQFQWVGAPGGMIFDVIPFMLIGMALLKWGVLSGTKSLRFYLTMALLGYGVGLPLGFYELGVVLDSKFTLLGFVESGRTYQISRLAMVVGHLGLALAMIRSGLFAGLQRALAAVGQMALSNYIAQTLICTMLFYGFGFGLFGKLARYELYYVVGSIWLVELVWSSLWLARYRFGPLEWLWRSLTYWQRQPMRLAAS
jgi:uncharacterized protein